MSSFFIQEALLDQLEKLGMNIMRLIRNSFKKNDKFKEQYVEELRDDPVYAVAAILRHMAINCACGDICIPVEHKGNVYRCIRCSKETAGHAYNFSRSSYILQSSQPDEPLLDMDLYDDAIDLLSKAKKRRLTFKQWKYRLKH